MLKLNEVVTLQIISKQYAPIWNGHLPYIKFRIIEDEEKYKANQGEVLVCDQLYLANINTYTIS